MGHPDIAALQPLLGDRREAIAKEWLEALALTSFVPFGWGEVRDRLAALVERVVAALCAEPFDRRQAQAIGAALVRLHYGHPAALSATQEVLSAALIADLSPAQVVAIQPRLLALLGGLAAGFLQQVQAHTLDEQEAIRGALLTQRRRAEEALRASEERFRAVFAEAASGIGLADLEGRIVEINRAWEEMLGYDRGEMVGMRITDVLHPDEVPAAWAMYGEMMAGRRRLYRAEQRHLRKDGQVVWCDLTVSIVHDAAGRPQFAVGMAVNVTQRKQAEAVVAEQYRLAETAQGEMRGILDATGEAMLLVAPDDRVLTTNQRFTEFFLLSEDLARGRPLTDLRAEFARIFDHATVLEPLDEQRADPDARFTRDVAQVWPVRRTLELFSTPVVAGGGRRLGRLYSFRDVTREREVDRMKSEFVSLVSHELRTPLTSIKGYVDLLLAGDVGEVSAEQREFLGIVRHNSERLVALIEDLLDIARMEEGQIELRHSAMDIGRVIREVAASLRPQVARKGQRLVLRTPKGLPAVWGDTERVTQILTNLLSNAYKYTPTGGRITVAATLAGDGVQIAVRDTGIGLSPDEVAQLFTRFFRAKHRTVQEAGGTGLGLAITRSLVAAHGGQITVQSSPGQGSTFSVTLPTVPAGAPTGGHLVNR
jgi:PAS domain S-box-containing protein